MKMSRENELIQFLNCLRLCARIKGEGLFTLIYHFNVQCRDLVQGHKVHMGPTGPIRSMLVTCTLYSPAFTKEIRNYTNVHIFVTDAVRFNGGSENGCVSYKINCGLSATLLDPPMYITRGVIFSRIHIWIIEG